MKTNIYFTYWKEKLGHQKLQSTPDFRFKREFNPDSMSKGLAYFNLCYEK